MNPFPYKRRATREVLVGHVGVGGNNPIRLQSMTTTDTMNTEATVAQVLRLAEVGCEIARITAPTVLDAKNLEFIKSTLVQKGCNIPLVADIHFRPDAAMAAADDDGLVAQRWIIALFDRRIEGVAVHVRNREPGKLGMAGKPRRAADGAARAAVGDIGKDIGKTVAAEAAHRFAQPE